MAAVVSAWLITRVGLVVAVLEGWYPQQSPVTGDIRIYHRWAAELLAGRFPVHDLRWQYPPGAALPILAGSVAGSHYRDWFLAVMLALDLVGLLVLLRPGGHGLCRTPAAWLWTLGLAALGPVTWFRFDLVPTVLTVAALAVGGVAGGLLLGLGGWVKLWPVLALPVLRRGGSAVVGLVAAGVVGAVGLIVAGAGPALLSMAHHQGSRGLEIESVLAAGFLVGDVLGHPARPRYHYGSFQFTGAHVTSLLRLGTALDVVVVVGYLAGCCWLRFRGARPPVGLAFCGLLGVMLASRVLSAQYLVWLVGLAAVAVRRREPGQLAAAALVGGAAVLTQVLYPATYLDLIAGHPLNAAVLLARDVLLVAALAVATWGVVRGVRSTREMTDLRTWAADILAQ